jgi:type II secretory pathway component GspD/PulD (secretin)
MKTSLLTCVDVKTCSKLMFDLKGQRYIWDGKMEDYKFLGTPDVELTKDNAELVFTAILDQMGLARMPVGDGKTYRVVKSPYIKEIETPIVEASAENRPTFPSNTWDWVTMRYHVKSPESAPSIESMYRLHVPREGRMQADENAGLIIVTGQTPMVRQMYETIKAADKPLSPSAKKHYEEYRARSMNPPPPVIALPPPGPAPAAKSAKK